MNSRSLPRTTAAECAARAYDADVHPAARALLDAVAQLHAYQPTDRSDLAKLLRSLGGDTTGSTNAVAEIGALVKNLVQHPVTGDLPRSERAAAVELAAEYGEVQLGEAEDTVNQLLHVVEGHPAPADSVFSRVARALGGNR
ncbi:hypothetical protein ABT224_19940 [Streptomyces sp. NPDC001584]|uniref:hypothetical protein n=1 Tax=Streptomyces sp. NPDC001584 TaxID=3154521 RepID=UPI00331D5806